MILKLRRSWSGLALGAGLVALCALGTGSAHANSQLPQTPLPGKSVPKFVDPLPVFGPASGGAAPRVDGTKPLTVTMKEFQQKVLPASFYTGLPVPLPGDPDFRLG